MVDAMMPNEQAPLHALKRMMVAPASHRMGYLLVVFVAYFAAFTTVLWLGSPNCPLEFCFVLLSFHCGVLVCGVLHLDYLWASVFHVFVTAVCCIAAYPSSWWFLPYCAFYPTYCINALTAPVGGKGFLRSLFLGSALVSVACCVELFIYILQLLFKENPIDRAFLLLICLCVMYLLCAFFASWGFARLSAASDPWFFSRVLRTDRLDHPATIVKPETAETYLLSALIRPSSHLIRITDYVRPGTGSFSVQSELEFKIPGELFGSDRNPKSPKLYFPVVFQGKPEFNRELEITAKYGLPIRRLRDDELNSVLCKAFCDVFSTCGWQSIPESYLHEFVHEALDYYANETDYDFYQRLDSLLFKLRLNNDFQLGLLSEFFVAVRFVKPVCFEVPNKEVTHFSNVALLVTRSSPLVPLRKTQNGLFQKAYLRIKRFFTKKRLHFYYGLGNADCAQSYHLAITCPDNTFLAGMQIVRVGGAGEVFICKDISVSSRCDQATSRIYIREGRGFSRAALSFSFERRSHKPLAALVATSAISLVASLYLYTVVSPDLSGSTAFLPITLLSVGTLITVWQAMEEYRAEEWLWLCIAAVAVSSMTIVIMILLNKLLSEMFPEQLRIAWQVCLMAQFTVMVVSALVLFGKLKLHGALMDRVPRLRQVPSADPSSIFKYNFAELIAQQEYELTHGMNAVSSGKPMLWNPNRALSLGRKERYMRDISAYSILLSLRWTDGWLMPVWASSMNPYRQPSKVFVNSARRSLKYQR